MNKLYARIPHLPGSRPGLNDRVHNLAAADKFTVAAPKGAQVIVEEKLDGSCVSICRGIAAEFALRDIEARSVDRDWTALNFEPVTPRA
jgi:hypothetical protein